MITPVDVLLLALLVVGYLFGLLLLAVARLRRTEAARQINVAIALYVGLPLLWAANDLYRKHEAEEWGRRTAAANANVEAELQHSLAAYCSNTADVFNGKGKGSASAVLRIEILSNYTHRASDVSAEAVADALRRRTGYCNAPSLGYVEDELSGHVRRVAICGGRASDSKQVDYQLILGQRGDREALPWGQGGGYQVSKSSVALREVTNGRAISEGTLFFTGTRYHSLCSSALARIVQMVTESLDAQRPG